MTVGGGQGQRGRLPGRMFLLAPRQLGFRTIDRLLPNQSRAEIGGRLDSLGNILAEEPEPRNC